MVCVVFGLVFNWHLFWIILALYWICCIMFSVVFVRGLTTRITCLNFSLLCFSEIEFDRG